MSMTDPCQGIGMDEPPLGPPGPLGTIPPQMAPSDQETTHHRVESDPWARRLGISSAGNSVFTMELTQEHLNFLGGGHGGVLYSLADVAFATAASAHGADPVTLDTHLVLTAGTRAGDVLSATVETINSGRTLATIKVDVTRSDGRLVGSFTGTARFGGDS